MSLEEALELRRQCDYRRALVALDAAEGVEALLERSQLREDLGDTEGARDDAERALELGGGVLAQVRLAGIARAERRPLDALEILSEMEGPEAAAERACALAEVGRADQAEQALALVRAVSDRLAQAVTLTRAGIASLRGDYEAAERILGEALSEAEATFGAASLEAATVLNATGMLFKYSGRFDEATALYARALGIVERAVGETHPDVATLYHNLGGLAHARHDLDEAERAARRGIEIRRRVSPSDSPALAEDEAALAPILHALGQDDEAEPMLRRSIPILERTLGDEHPEVAGAWNNLGSILYARDDLAGAAEAFGRSLAAKEKLLGPGHPAVAITMNNLAIVLRQQGDTAAAEDLYKRALEALASVEPDHPNRLRTLANYAGLLHSIGRTDEAEQLDELRKNLGAPSV